MATNDEMSNEAGSAFLPVILESGSSQMRV